jgi:gamma-glutamylcyclotransferase (GGCT)/AIG2-like uncharacterized protein YtfP
MEDLKHLIFIYDDHRIGNKKNFNLFHSRFIGVGKTLNEYTMFVARVSKEVMVTEDEIESSYPKSKITGEVYEISNNLLISFDHFILKDPNWQRKSVDINIKNNIYNAYIYFHNEILFSERHIRLGGKRFFPVPSGDWSNFNLVNSFKKPPS